MNVMLVTSDPLLHRLSLLRANIESVFMGKPGAVEQVLVHGALKLRGC